MSFATGLSRSRIRLKLAAYNNGTSESHTRTLGRRTRTYHGRPAHKQRHAQRVSVQGVLVGNAMVVEHGPVVRGAQQERGRGELAIVQEGQHAAELLVDVGRLQKYTQVRREYTQGVIRSLD